MRSIKLRIHFSKVHKEVCEKDLSFIESLKNLFDLIITIKNIFTKDNFTDKGPNLFLNS